MYKNYIEVLSNHLIGKKWRKHYSLIIYQMHCINESYKPCVLWDIGLPDLNVLINLVKKLKSDSLLKPFIYLMEYENEIFIVNLKKTCEYLRECCVKFINCDLNIEKPVIIDNDSLLYKNVITDNVYSIQKHLLNFLECFNNRNTDIFDSHLSNDLLTLKIDTLKLQHYCPPTVFGVLLGYPIVYWSSLNNIKNGNCLSFISLNVYKIQVTDLFLTEFVGDDHLLYSFSAPRYLNLNNHIDSWVDEFKKSFLDNVKIKVTIEIVVLPSVQL